MANTEVLKSTDEQGPVHDRAIVVEAVRNMNPQDWQEREQRVKINTILQEAGYKVRVTVDTDDLPEPLNARTLDDGKTVKGYLAIIKQDPVLDRLVSSFVYVGDYGEPQVVMVDVDETERLNYESPEGLVVDDVDDSTVRAEGVGNTSGKTQRGTRPRGGSATSTTGHSDERAKALADRKAAKAAARENADDDSAQQSPHVGSLPADNSGEQRDANRPDDDADSPPTITYIDPVKAAAVASFRKHRAEKFGQPSTSEAIEDDSGEDLNEYERNDDQKWAVAQFNSSENPEGMDLFNVSNELNHAREKLATARVKARRPGLSFVKSWRERQLNKAEQEYESVLGAVERTVAGSYVTQTEYDQMKEQLEQRYTGYSEEDREYAINQTLQQFEVVTVNKKHALLAEFKAREDGARIGEEVNYFLTKEDSRFKRAIEVYQKLGDKQKLAVDTVGTAAIIGAGIMTAGSGWVVGGALLGARAGKIYGSRETSRDRSLQGTSRSERLLAKQQTATLDRSSQQDYIDEYEPLRNYRSQGENGLFQKVTTAGLQAAVNEIRAQRDTDAKSSYQTALEQAAKNSEQKRKTAAWSIGGAAAGATIGYALGEAFEALTGADEAVETLADSDAVDAASTAPDADMPSPVDSGEAGGIDAGADASPAAPEVETPPPAPEPVVIDGVDVTKLQPGNVTITEQGDNFWNAIERFVNDGQEFSNVDARQAAVDRLVDVANDSIAQDLNKVQAGQSFTITQEMINKAFNL